MTYPMLEDALEDGVLTLTLRLNETNRLTPEAISLVDEALAQKRDDPRVRSLLLTSGMKDVFSDGLDPTQVYGKTEHEIATYVRAAIEMVVSVFDFPVPVVCAISGHALAAGAVLACCADYRFIRERGARIGFPEVSIGMNFPSFAAERLRDLMGERATQDLLYTGSLLKPDAALTVGLVDAVHPADTLLTRAQEKAQLLARGRSGSLRGLKSALRAGYRKRSAELIDADVAALTRIALTKDAQEGMLSLIQARRARFGPDA